MDDPGLEPERHARALRALEVVNVLSWTAGRVWRAVARLGAPAGRPIRVLDVACGGGDVVVSLARRAQRAGLALEVHGCDRSPVALDHARRGAERAGVEARFLAHDALAGPLPGGYDLVTSSLFLHHLSEGDAVGFLRRAAEAAPALLAQDLLRTRRGWLLAAATLHTLACSDVARVDGVRSVAGAFTLEEARALARSAGLDGATVGACWPQRFALWWRRR